MNNINLRLYGEQLYPNISKYLTKYISPEILKEEFLSSYKNGSIQIKSLKLKEKLLIHPQILIEELFISNVKIKIPDEKENLEINIENAKCFWSISELDENELEKIMLNERIKEIDEFINYAINKIEKKDGPSFLDNIIKSVIDKILNGFSINIHNMELKISSNNHKNIYFIFNIENANFNNDKGIVFKNFCIIYQEDLIKKTVIEKFDFNIDIIHENKEEAKKNKLNIYISDIILQINKNVYFEFLHLYELFDEAEYKRIYLLYKKLIQYHRPLVKENGKVDYKALWKYGVKTVINLQKYIQKNEENIFDLKYSSQLKIIKNYLENNKNNKNIILPDLKNILKYTKETVEKKVLENKKGNFFAKSFSFFFGKKEDDKKEELTEEEKEIIKVLYEDENIIKYLKKEINLNITNLSSIFNNMKLFFSNFSTEFNFEKLELILQNSSNKQNLFIKGMKLNINYFNKELDFEFFINDIGYEKEKSFLGKKDFFYGDAITLKKIKPNFINLDFGFNNVELNEELVVFLLSFGNSITTEKRIKLFHEKKGKKNVDFYNNEEMINNIKKFSFMNNFKISNIPSFSIKCKENKIDFLISNYSLSNNSINFNLEIKDSYSIILKSYNFNPKKENNQFIFHLDDPLEINLLSKSSKIIFLNYLRYQKELSSNNNKRGLINRKTKNELFGFNYKSYTDIDLGNLDMNDYMIDIKINKIDIKIFEEKENYQSRFLLENFRFLYQKKNLDFNINKIIISTNLMSTIILYILDFESPLLEQYKKKLDLEVNDANDILAIVPGNENKDDNQKELYDNVLKIQKSINYSKLFEEILKEFNFNLDIFSFIFQSDNFIISLNLNNIKSFKKKEEKDEISLYSSIDNWNLSIDSSLNNIKNKKIIDNNKIFLISYGFNEEIVKGELKSIYMNMNMEDIMQIWDSTKFLLNQINWDIILCKMDFKVYDFVLSLDQFKYSVNKILFINFREKCDKDNAFYITFFELIMMNQKGNKIIYEKKLIIDYLFTSSTENDISIKFNEVNIEISQNDISFLLSFIKIPKKKDEQNLQRKTNVIPNSSYKKLNSEKSVDLLGFEEIKHTNKNSDKIETRMSLSGKLNEKKKKFTLSLIVNIPKLNLCLCFNDYNKFEEISMESSTLKIKNIFYENILNQELSNELTYKLLFGKLNFSFFYSKNNEINILSKIKTFVENNNDNDDNIIKDEKKNNGVNNINQIEFISQQNGYIINLNQNEINIRIDIFIMIYYYFKAAIPNEEIIEDFDQIDLNLKNESKFFQIQINFNDSKFELCTSFSGKENLYLDINKFFIIYTGNKNLPYGNYIIILNQLSAIISKKNNIRQLFYTSKEFLQIKMNLTEELLSANVEMDHLNINLSYRDLVSFLRAYLLNFKILNDNIKKYEDFLKNRVPNTKNNSKSNYEFKKKNEINNRFINSGKITPAPLINKKLIFTGEFNFEKLDITLIDNSKGSYHPFMNIINNKIYLILNPDKSIEASFSFQLFSYNYIACIWEPTIENTIIKLSNLYIQRELEISNKLKLEINNININLSDMAISFTLLSLNNLFEKFSKKKKKFEMEKQDKTQIETTDNYKKFSKISNNQVINYTGMNFKILHNGKIIDCPPCPPFKPIKLEYINEYTKTKKKLKYITLIYDEKNKFEIPLEIIITLRHTLNNGISFVSDNAISENRTINVILYSTIIIKNRSIYPLQIAIESQTFNKAYLVSNPNSITGIPLNLVNKSNNFNFMFIKEKNHKTTEGDYSQNFNIGAIEDLPTDIEYNDFIKFKKKYLFMKLDHKIHNVRTLIINTEYSIVNCLPCNLTINFSHKKDVIKKCTQYYLDEKIESKLYVAFTINTSNGEFKSEGFDILSLQKKKTEEKFLKFYNNKQSFKLLYDFKQNEEENTLIIYAEYILYNKTDIILSVHSRDKDNDMLCFGIEKNISLITSKFDYKEAYLQLLNADIISKKVKLSSLIEKSPYSEIEMRNENGDKIIFYIKKKFSYINIINNPNFKDNIMSNIFTIFPTCIITNLLPNKRFFICDYQFQKNYQIINPFNKSYFYFFGHGTSAQLGISVLNMESNKYSHIIKFKFEIGVFTLSTFEDSFNIEIRKNPSNGCLDVFIIQNDLENSKIIMENLSGEGINIYQRNYEKYMQILETNQIQTLKIYDYESPVFFIETSNSVCEIKFDKMEEREKTIELNKKIILLIQANGIKMKLIFYPINEYNKSKSIMNINSFEVRINSIMLSLIGDNEFQDNKLAMYHRYELLLIIFNELSVNITVETISGVLSKNSVKSIINIGNFQIHNQVSEKGKFPIILQNTEAFLSLYNELDYYEKLKIVKIKTNNLFIGKMLLGIDPEFFIELLDFFGNIFYRMNITNFIVNELFQKVEEFENEEEKINYIMKEYDQSKILLNAKNFEIPDINIRFELTNIGIKDLLKKRIGLSEFYYWLTKGLIGRAHSLKLESFRYPYNNGGIGNFFKGLLYQIRAKLENKLIDIGLKGLIGQIKNIFSYDDSNMNDMNNKRLREKRAFYGKFMYFKDYDKRDAYYINGFFKKYKVFKYKYYPLHIVYGYKKFYLFTTISMLIIEYKNFILTNSIDFFYIKKITRDKLQVKVEYNQIIDSVDNCIILCEDEIIADNINKTLKEEIINNKEFVIDI